MEIQTEVEGSSPLRVVFTFVTCQSDSILFLFDTGYVRGALGMFSRGFGRFLREFAKAKRAAGVDA
jgi:hypothetical protein